MASIEEIPLENDDNRENFPDNSQEIQESPENPQETQDNVPETPAPKKKGRPPGARNKPKAPPPTPKPAPKASAPKPKPPKRKPVIEEEEYEESSEDEPQRVPQVDRHQLASEVLGLLQQQRYNQANAKRNHYASWFQNMR